MDAWFEQDEEVLVHPRDPYHRVDVLESSRHVRVSVGGEGVAKTDRLRVLFETGLPPRNFTPPGDVRDDVLLPSDKNAQCPSHEVVASYHSLQGGEETVEDLVWHYPELIAAAEEIRDRPCFFNENVDP
jgi:uncharacterized protein (DUF427 family)